VKRDEAVMDLEHSVVATGFGRCLAAVAARYSSMENAPSEDNGKATLRGFAVVVGIALGFLLWGFLVYFAVGDKGAPSWNFGVVPDIPGQSPYSTHSTKRLPIINPSPEGAAQGVSPQHVLGPPGKAGIVQPNGGQ
jgi:hypothetical protein